MKTSTTPRRIAETFRGFAGEYCKPRSSTGLLVRRVQCGTESARDMACECVDALIRGGWANNQIALLTTRHRHPEHQEYLDRGALAD